MAPVNVETGKMTQQERADATVPDHENVASVVRLQNAVHFVNNPFLGVNCAFPAVDAFERARKELVRRTFKRLGRQVPCRGAIILVHALADLNFSANCFGNDLCRFDGFALGTRDYALGTRQCRVHGKQPRALPPYIVQAPFRDWNRWIDLHLRVREITHE